MNKLILILLISFALKVSAQKIITVNKVTDHSFYVVGNNFEGIIFLSNYYKWLPSEVDTLKLFTPTVSDVINAENLLRKDIKKKDGHVITDVVIRRNLNKYLRQYMGYINSKGQKILYINLFWGKEILEEENIIH